MKMNGHDAVRHKRSLFRKILRRKKLTVMPGGFSPLYARLAQQAGFDAFFLAGSQLSAFLYGVPDNGIIGLRELVDHARHMAAAADIPIQVDADTGFGNAVNVYYAVREIVRSGVACLNIEDQEAPKKSATNAGRRCISMAEALGKIQAAVAARDEIDPEFSICARCDILGAEGSSFDDALERCVAYIEQGGADFVWLNSVETRKDLKRACKEIPAPVLAIWGGNDAPPSIAEYEALGVRIALFPVQAATSGLQASWEFLNDLREKGSRAMAEWNVRADSNRWGRPDHRMLLRLDDVRNAESRFLPSDLQRDYVKTWGHKTNFNPTATAVRAPAKRAARRK
ncbi:MAG TPA: isocitrate lyase/PEP mutase family protein [Stellaceae bacterium]|nr:isocitrate lyase/PEP mutase family protein [Stellaceae bacterium]